MNYLKKISLITRPQIRSKVKILWLS